MILRDFYCTSCGMLLEDVAVSALGVLRIDDVECENCGDTKCFEPLCNGGMRSRYRFADWPSDPDFYRGQSKVISATAMDSEGEPVRRFNGQTKEVGAPMHAADKYHNGSDERETRRDKIHHATRRTRGKSPIVCDLGAK